MAAVHGPQTEAAHQLTRRELRAREAAAGDVVAPTAADAEIEVPPIEEGPDIEMPEGPEDLTTPEAGPADAETADPERRTRRLRTRVIGGPASPDLTSRRTLTSRPVPVMIRDGAPRHDSA